MDQKQKFFSNSDLAKRWGVTKHVAYVWGKRKDHFPEPSHVVGGGTVPVYALEDVERFEKLNNIKPKGADNDEKNDV